MSDGHPDPEDVLAVLLALKASGLTGSFGPGGWIDPDPVLRRTAEPTPRWRSTVWIEPT